MQVMGWTVGGIVDEDEIGPACNSDSMDLVRKSNS
jgi:hypothetical protein